jgi:tetratricopeptide (TPR) repeat protein
MRSGSVVIAPWKRPGRVLNAYPRGGNETQYLEKLFRSDKIYAFVGCGNTMELTIEQALQRAVENHKAGKLQDAEALYRAILQNQPKNPDANHNLGVIAVSLNKTEAALPLFKIALEANPNLGQFWLSYVDALIKEKQFDDARNVLEQGKKKGLTGEKVDFLESQLMTSFLTPDSELLSKNNLPTTSQQLKKVPTKRQKKKNASRNLTEPNQIESPPQIKIYNLLGYYQKGQLDLALNLATVLTQQYPNHPFAWKVLGAVFRQTGRLQESLITNQRAVALSPNDTEALNSLGITLKELGRLKDAEASYSKAIAIKPEYAEAHSNLANTLKELGRLEEAEASYSKAIAIKPEYAEAHYNLGNTLNELGRLEEAEASYRKAIAIKPEYAHAHYNLANMLQELGRLEDAKASYRKAIAIKPDFVEAHSNFALTLKELGRFDDAEASFKNAIAIKPDYADAHSNLGLILKELGRLEEAETSCNKAIAIKPDYAEAHSNLGLILKELGRLEEAETSCNKAIAIKPDYADAYSNLGIILKSLGRIAEAKASFAEAVRLKPDFIKARNEILTCLYLMDKKSLFLDELDHLIKQDKASSVIGSFTCRSALRYGEEKLNIFCKKPLDHVVLVDLKSRYNFEEIFVRNVNSILTGNNRSNKKQNLLSNGYQTSGNLFDIGNNFTDEIQKIIRLEIDRYLISFKNSDEGFIRKWPIEYSLYGWLISMKSGGELLPHIHENGWISGSIYINVPPKTKIDSGSLVVALGRDSDATNSRLNLKKVFNVVTGSMALFPASLMHHTIPFESEEERIVLAFDVIPKSKEAL